MLWEELKKIWIKQHVLFVLVILLLVQAGYVSCRGLYSHKVTKTAERNEKIYEEFYSQLKGKWNQKKEAQLDTWLKERDDCLIQYNTLVDKLMTGEISEDILYKYYFDTPFCQTRFMDVLDDLEKQRDYIKKNISQRYMMKTNGWVYFFEDHFIYYLYFLFLLVIFIPLFIREKITKMNLMQKLSAKGQNKIFNNKILAAVIIMWSGILLLSAEKYFLYYARCGMENITYPIQSLSLFEDCPWNICIGVVIMVEILLLACAGYLLGGVIIFCSVFIPKTIDVCLIIMILVFVPMFIISREIMFRYPNMTSILYPDQLVYGWRDIDIGAQIYKTQKELQLIGAVAVLVGTVLLWISRKRGQGI